MSRRTTKSRFSTQHILDKNYKLYAINVRSPRLKPMIDKLQEMIETGTRRSVFVINVDEEIIAMQNALKNGNQEEPARVSLKKIRKDSSKPITRLSAVLHGIERCRKTFIDVNINIENEIKFDLVEFWLRHLNRKVKKLQLTPVVESTAGSRTTAGKKKTRLSQSQVVKQPPPLPPGNNLEDCPKFESLEHNIIGQPERTLTRRYKEDEPEGSKLFIVLVGTLSNEFYHELLSHNEPLQAIVDCVIQTSLYDTLLRRPSFEYQLKRIQKEIDEDVIDLRKNDIYKPVGVFNLALPLLSDCLVKKYEETIYDEMSWFIYDVETLRSQYELYYFVPFKITNVSMDDIANLSDMLYEIQRLSMTSHYLKTPLPGVASDEATINAYLEGIFSKYGDPSELLTELDARLLTTPPAPLSLFTTYHRTVDNLRNMYKNAFKSVTKIRRYDRLFIDEMNLLLLELIEYTSNLNFYHIYHTCLEYNVLHQRLVPSRLVDLIPYQPYFESRKGIELPQYAKMYVGEHSVIQRLEYLYHNYMEFYVIEIHPKLKMYTFLREYDRIYKYRCEFVIPSRLCFRDFTIFQKDEFLEEIVTPERREEMAKQRLSSVSEANPGPVIDEKLNELPSDMDSNIFIRPESLKFIGLTEFERGDFSRFGPMKAHMNDRRGSIPIRTLSYDARKVSLTSSDAEHYVGLPPDHHLLFGYNLDEVRQDLYLTVSKYFFEEGYIMLHEDRHRFTECNKLIYMSLVSNKLTICTPNDEPSGIHKNFQIITRNKIHIRASAKPKECAKIVINYPNGLGIYYRDTYTEQMWLGEDSYNNERRRLMTPNGVVIVHFNDDDMILVMRYNGEVYQLYQYEFDELEEMEYEYDLGLNIENVDVKDRESETARQTIESKITDIRNTIESKDPTTGKRKSKKRRSKSAKNNKTKTKMSSRQKASATISDSLNYIPMKSMKEYLYESVHFELIFIKYLMSIYNISYMHLVIITSGGRVVNLTKSGKIYEGRRYLSVEWHDYFANESYCMREDGVKLIWTQDTLKCYHTDGTTFTTRTQDSVESFDELSDLDTSVQKSSSHEGVEEESEYKEGQIVLVENNRNTFEPIIETPHERVLPQLEVRQITNYIMYEFEEEQSELEDTSYISYTNDSFLMQHENYAGVFIFLLNNYLTDAKVYMEIYGKDDINVNVANEQFFFHDDWETHLSSPQNTDSLYATSRTNFLRNTTPSGATKTSERNSKDANEETLGSSDPLNEKDLDEPRLNYKIIIGEDFRLFIWNESIEISAELSHFDEEFGPIKELLHFKMEFDSSLPDIFNHLVESIRNFKKYPEKKTELVSFIERTEGKVHPQGFEMVGEIPSLGEFHHRVSNNTTIFRKVSSINEQMSNKFEWKEVDMRKFPRFPIKNMRRRPFRQLPHVLTSIIYVEIPLLLRNSREVHKFIKPLDHIVFKLTRPQINNALLYAMRPRMKLAIQKKVSKLNWAIRHREHEKRIFIETQRTALYEAMLTYNMFPVYQKFVHDFMCRVESIDFFDFVFHTCKAGPQKAPQETDEVNDDEEKDTQRNPKHSKEEILKRLFSC